MIDLNALYAHLDNVVEDAQYYTMANFHKDFHGAVDRAVKLGDKDIDILSAKEADGSPLDIGKRIETNQMMIWFNEWIQERGYKTNNSQNLELIRSVERDDSGFQYRPIPAMADVNIVLDTNNNSANAEKWLQSRWVKTTDWLKKAVASLTGRETYLNPASLDDKMANDLIEGLKAQGWEYKKITRYDDVYGCIDVEDKNVLVHPTIKEAFIKVNVTDEGVVTLNGQIPLSKESDALKTIQDNVITRTLAAEKHAARESGDNEKALAIDNYIGNLKIGNENTNAVQNLHYDTALDVVRDVSKKYGAAIALSKKLSYTIPESLEKEFYRDIIQKIVNKLKDIVKSKGSSKWDTMSPKDVEAALINNPEPILSEFLKENRLPSTNKITACIDRDDTDFSMCMDAINILYEYNIYSLTMGEDAVELTDYLMNTAPSYEKEMVNTYAKILTKCSDAQFGFNRDTGVYIISNVKKVINGEERRVRYEGVVNSAGKLDVFIIEESNNFVKSYDEQQRFENYRQSIIKNAKNDLTSYLTNACGKIIGMSLNLNHDNCEETICGIQEDKVKIDRSIATDKEGNFLEGFAPLSEALANTSYDKYEEYCRMLNSAPPGLIMPVPLNINGNENREVILLVQKNDIPEMLEDRDLQKLNLDGSENGFTVRMDIDGVICDATVAIGNKQLTELFRSIENGTREMSLEKAYNLVDRNNITVDAKAMYKEAIAGDTGKTSDVTINYSKIDALLGRAEEISCSYIKDFKDTIDSINAISPEPIISASYIYSGEFEVKNVPHLGVNSPSRIQLDNGEAAYIPVEKRNTDAAAKLLATNSEEIKGISLTIGDRTIDITSDNYKSVVPNELFTQMYKAAFETNDMNAVAKIPDTISQLVDCFDKNKVSIPEFARIMTGDISIDNAIRTPEKTEVNKTEHKSPAENKSPKPNKPKFDRTDD